MLTRTHFIISSFFILLLLSFFEDKVIFITVTLVATLLPDIDSKFSKFGRLKALRLIQFFVKHRGILHSFTFLFFIGLVFYFFLPIVLYPFLLGYSLHLILDGMTKQGIRPLYPLKGKIRGKMRTGGRFESIVFVLFLLGDLYLIFDLIL